MSAPPKSSISPRATVSAVGSAATSQKKVEFLCCLLTLVILMTSVELIFSLMSPLLLSRVFFTGLLSNVKSFGLAGFLAVFLLEDDVRLSTFAVTNQH